MNTIFNLTDMMLFTIRQGLSFGKPNQPVLLLCSCIGIILLVMYSFRCQNNSEVSKDEPGMTPNEPVMNSNEPEMNPNEPVMNSNEPVINSSEPVINSSDHKVTATSDEYIAESVADLMEYLHSYLMRHGIDVNNTSLAFLLANFAGREMLQIKQGEGTDAELIEQTVQLLSRFFRKDSGEFIPVYRESEALRIAGAAEIYAIPCGPFSEYDDGFISLTGYRSLIRDTEDEYFISEAVWRKIDVVQEQCRQKWHTEFQNKVVRCAEKMSSVLIAAGQSEQTAFQYIWQTVLLPSILKTGDSVDTEELNQLYEDCLKSCRQ